MSLTVHTRNSGSVEIITLAGRLVLGEATSGLREKLRLVAARPAHALLDLSGVTYMDSAGLGELVAGFSAVTAAGRTMKLLRPAHRVDSMLHMTKLYSTFEVFEEEKPALESFARA